MAMKCWRNNNCQIFYDENLIKKIDQNIFDINFWQKKDAVLGKAHGRGITWFVQTETLPAALRHYHRGGLFGKLIKDSYFYTGFKHTRCVKEFELLQYLHDHQFPVPQPIAAQVQKSGLVYRADILVEKIQNATDLVAILINTPLLIQEYKKIGQLIKKMHDLQVCHTDLNIHNILKDINGVFWLIDFDKCGKRAGNGWKKANIDRLYRSFCKEKKRVNIQWSEQDWQSLMSGYTFSP